MKKIICTALLSGMLTVQAAALPEMGALYAKSAALYAANGQELYVYNADEQLQPASVTKIMTMLLAMEALERGEVTLDTMITGSEYACSMGGTQIWLEPGEQLSLDEMLKAIAVGSANDCAVAVAEHLAGTEAAFVERMNANTGTRQRRRDTPVWRCSPKTSRRASPMVLALRSTTTRAVSSPLTTVNSTSLPYIRPTRRMNSSVWITA